ncbi:hypothetical protein SAMN05421493_101162 [Pseudobutyrivibrio sp. 49]|uniref:hypothetical protein n=1 Tax=unclassified Pseudobutyrivibrio TaxID=2638619 RepID=UPI00088557EE|nr:MULTISPECIES: hypothetical protein [unclassified Pseudobutyrivibrio]SDH29577.1 hypothetical protein SAMN05421493_101162 [Pseudobutyrivibrio sp. 49]SFN51880.1 hypothetical protein SAMN04487831_101521 [Pseudobutyrivibrio sp. UC1225]
MNKKEGNNKDILISDSGLTKDARTKQAKIFVLLCDILTIALIVLGIIAFIKGGNI